MIPWENPFQVIIILVPLNEGSQEGQQEARGLVISEDDGTGMPKSVVAFKWEFEVVHQNVSNVAIMFEWFSSNSQVERYDTGLVEAWTVKADNTLTFERVFDPLRVEEEMCKMLAQRKFYIIAVNCDDMKVRWEVQLDLGALLTDRRDQPDFRYENSKLPIIEIENLRIRISADKQLLMPIFRQYLNPLTISVIGAKGVPSQDRKYENVYVSYEFFDGVSVSTPSLPHSGTLRWDAKHVHLLGSLDQNTLKERLGTQLFKVQVHDCDELLDTSLRKDQDLLDIEAWLKAEDAKNKPPEPVDVPDPKKKGGKEVKKEPPKKEAPKKDTKKKDVKLGEPVRDPQPQRSYNRNNYGIAAYYLSDLLKPNVRTVKLQAPVVPRKQFEDVESSNLDLNTTAKQNLPKMFLSSNYMDNSCYLLVEFDISVGIGTFKKPQVEQPSEPVDQKKGTKPPVPVPVVTPSQPIVEANLAPVYERAVYIMPYKQREFVQALQKVFYQVNMACFPFSEGGLRALTTKALTESEKKGMQDYLGGFEILDSDFRLFVIEGLSTGGMKTLADALQREAPNTETVKILKNPDIKFKERMYTDFNIEIKRIRLRENLSKLLIKPDLYIRTKVPENIQETLVKVQNILKQWNVRVVAQFNLFPKASDLIAVERKYSDSLTDEDITGVETTSSPKQKKQHISDQTLTDSKTQNQSVRFQQVTATRDKSTEILIQQSEVSPTANLRTGLKSKSKPKNLDHYTLQMKTYRPESAQRGVYSGQANNDYETQLKALRERIRNDPNNFYTYSKDYLSLSIDPYDIEEEKKKNLQASEKQCLINGRPKFRSVVPTTKEDYRIPKKTLSPSKLDELRSEKYHEQQKLKEEISKPTKQLKAFPDGSKAEFKQYIESIDVFSLPVINENEKISPAQRDREMRELKKKESENFKAKCMGPTFFYTKSRTFDKCDQIDKNKGLLEDKAIKKGLMVTNTQIKNSNIQLSRRIEHPPSSVFSQQPFEEPLDIFTRKVDLNKVVTDKAFDNYQEPEILTKSSVHKPLRKVQY